VRTLRVLTANVQSFPKTAITLDQAREDLRANADDGDIVLLQEIDSRYRRIVLEEFPSAAWHVYFGPRANHSPIAVRREALEVLEEHALQLHPGIAKVHEPRYLTHVHLRHRDLGVELHAVNLHLVSGAFHEPPKPDAAARQAEWHEGMRKHDRFIADLVASGAPVVCGGDYNRQLRKFRPQIQALSGGRRVSFGVDLASIDLIWFVDGTSATWDERGRTTFRGREGRPPRRRNSDHAARQATLALARTGAAAPDPGPSQVVIAADGTSAVKDRAKKDRKRKKKIASFVAQGQQSGGSASNALPTASGSTFAGPADQPFAMTEFGDTNPKRVDWKTRAALEEAERRLGYRLTVVQGSYNNGKVKASGPTHDGGGVVDLLAWDWRRKVAVLREIGFAAWYRPTRPGLWGAHIHAILIEHGRLDPSAAAQVVAYRAGRDGLKGSRADDFPRPNPIPVFSYPPRRIDPMMSGADHPGAVAQLGRPFPPNRTLDGIDISHHQSGRLDLTAAKRAGLRWMYVKATEGTSFKDKTHRARVRQARAAGLPVGAYHFARPEGGDAAAEARFFLANIDIRAGDMVPMLDLEDIGDLTLAQLTEWTGVWVRTVNQEIRRKGLSGKPVIYTPFNLTKGFGCLLWVARYSDDFRAPVIPRPWQRAAIWQHSNGRLGPVKHVPGVGRVDVNAMHPDLPLSALRLRRAGKPAASGRGTVRPPDLSLEAVAPIGSSGPLTATSGPTAVEQLPLVTHGAPTVTTSEVRGAPGDAGSVTITVTVPLPGAPAPLLVHPDLSPVEEQLALAARSLQGAIEALPERPEQ
jgi:GH25 family lysozyme M1 (1,4-beta-N-acetylmuramidase)